ncbi:hypothetical protein OG612_45415 (plasmid) [Streptomyces sp. NBC_01527]
MKTYKMLRPCRLWGERVHHATHGIVRLHSQIRAGQAAGQHDVEHTH